MKTFYTLITILLLHSSVYSQTFSQQLSTSAISLTKVDVEYDPSYFSIAYPNGDIPKGKGVCTDVVIRAYRELGIDLQKEVHEDMKANFEKYPKNWGLKTTDRNIDHRRVPNLRKFFERNNASISVTDKPKDYLPGDVVTWNLGRGITHIGIVIDEKTLFSKTPLIVHNIGAGQVKEDCLFKFEITGHYRYK